MLKKLYEKSEILFALLWIIAYVVLMSVGDSLSELIALQKSVTLAVAAFLSLALLFFLKRRGLLRAYGLTRPRASAKSMLYYLPIFAMLTANFWSGTSLNYGVLETILYICTMFCVGFLEEVIFRGLLFEAMRKDNTAAAVVVSSVTFGIGHIINLINGSGVELIPNILQVIYATAAGFMFVMMYLKSGSLAVPIAAHGLFNATSVFSGEKTAVPEMRMLSAALLTVITGGYAIYLAVSLRARDRKKTEETKGE